MGNKVHYVIFANIEGDSIGEEYLVASYSLEKAKREAALYAVDLEVLPEEYKYNYIEEFEEKIETGATDGKDMVYYHLGNYNTDTGVTLIPVDFFDLDGGENDA